MINNYYKPGPATISGKVRHRIANPSWANGKCGKWYVHGNVMEGNEGVTKDNWNGGIRGIIDSQQDVGGWPVLKSPTPPTDSDHDGMPDNWEKQHSLNPLDSNDGALMAHDCPYTNLEIYLSSIAE